MRRCQGLACSAVRTEALSIHPLVVVPFVCPRPHHRIVLRHVQISNILLPVDLSLLGVAATEVCRPLRMAFATFACLCLRAALDPLPGLLQPDLQRSDHDVFVGDEAFHGDGLCAGHPLREVLQRIPHDLFHKVLCRL